MFLLSALTWQRTQGDLGEGLLPGFVVGMSGFLGFQPAFMLCLLIMAWSSIWFFTSRIEKPGSRVLKILALTLCLSILVSFGDGGSLEGGSSLGGALAGRLVYVFGFTFSSLLVAAAALVFFLLSTDFFFYSYFEGIGRDTQRSKTSLDDEGVEAATVQAFESLAANPRERRELRAERAALRRRSPAGRPSLVIEEDPLDRVFPGPVDTTVAEEALAEEAPAAIEEPLVAAPEAESELEIEAGLVSAEEADEEVESIRVIERPSRRRQAEPVDSEAEVAQDHEAVEVTADLEIAAAEISIGQAEEEEEEEEEYEYEEEEEDEEEGEELEYEDEDAEEEAEEDDAEEEDEEEYEYEEEEVELEADEDAEDGDELEDDEEYEYVEVEYEEEEEAPEEEADELIPELPSAQASPVEELQADDELAESVEEPAVILPRPRRHSKRQGTLFPSAEGAGDLVDEAARLVIANDRASASFLRRRLRISRQEALGVIQSLCEQGVVDCPEGASQGRVIMDMAQWESR
ncbi:MAG: DNA translocase FtsK [Planctomycetota bacterium]